MPIREYKCPECGSMTEKILLAKADIDNPPGRWKCGKCGSFAELQTYPSTVSLGRSTFSEAPIDIQIGKDADVRWKDIHNRQEMRNKVRREAGDNGVVEVRKNEFQPITPERKAVLAEVERAVPAPPKLNSGVEVSKSWLKDAD